MVVTTLRTMSYYENASSHVMSCHVITDRPPERCFACNHQTY